MGSQIHVGVVGATGAIGREVLSVLDRVSWRPDEVSAAASPGTSVHAVDYGDQNLTVEDARDLDTGLLDAVIDDALAIDFCDIEQREASELSDDAFVAEYVLRRKPVVIRGGAKG